MFSDKPLCYCPSVRCIGLASVTTIGLFLLTSCVSRAPAPAPVPSPEHETSEPAERGEAPPDSSVAGDLSLHPAPGPAFVPPAFRVQAPHLGQRFERAAAAELEIVVEGGGPGLRIALDGHAFRPAPEGRIAVRRLLLEDEDLAVGPHRVVVLEDTEKGRSVVATWFWLDESSPSGSAPSPPPWGVVLVSPSGTYNGGPAADALEIDGFVLDALLRGETEPALVRVRGKGTWGQRPVRGELLRPESLDSGDYEIELIDLRGGKTGPWGSVQRTVTINRDAPNPEEP